MLILLSKWNCICNESVQSHTPQAEIFQKIPPKRHWHFLTLYILNVLLDMKLLYVTWNKLFLSIYFLLQKIQYDISLSSSTKQYSVIHLHLSLQLEILLNFRFWHDIFRLHWKEVMQEWNSNCHLQRNQFSWISKRNVMCDISSFIIASGKYN